MSEKSSFFSRKSIERSPSIKRKYAYPTQWTLGRFAVPRSSGVIAEEKIL